MAVATATTAGGGGGGGGGGGAKRKTEDTVSQVVKPPMNQAELEMVRSTEAAKRFARLGTGEVLIYIPLGGGGPGGSKLRVEVVKGRSGDEEILYRSILQREREIGQKKGKTKKRKM